MLAVVAFAVGLFCLFMPVRWLGYNPYKRQVNPGFDEAKAASRIWVVRLFGVVITGFGVACLLLAE
jgi:hypothetical protein